MLLYAYVSGNPLVLVDPLGLEVERMIGGYQDTFTLRPDRSIARRHYYDQDNNYLGYFDYDPGEPAEVVQADIYARDHNALAQLHKGARSVLTVTETGMAMAGVIIAVATPDPSDAVTLPALIMVTKGGTATRTIVRGMRAAHKTKKFRDFTRRNFAHNVEALTGVKPDNSHAHHLFQHSFRSNFREILGNAVNINDPRFGFWLDKDLPRASTS
jgi:hypothetical protein